MNDLKKFLPLAVRSTLFLLLSSGILIVLGIFNSFLDWDIFSAQIEKYLYALFASCLALAAVGVAVTIVLCVGSVCSLQAITADGNDNREPGVATIVLLVSIIVCMIVSGFAFANYIVQQKRYASYRLVAHDQYKIFMPRIAAELRSLTAPPRNNVPAKLFDYIKALDDMTVFSRATLYVPDPADKEALWGYTAWRQAYKEEDGFARFYPVKTFEKAMLSAVSGDTKLLDPRKRSSVF